MGPGEFVALAGLLNPYVTALFKALLGTKKKADNVRKNINTLIPLLIGIIVGTVKGLLDGGDLAGALVIGLTQGSASGFVGAGVRNLDKNIFGIASSVLKIFSKK